MWTNVKEHLLDNRQSRATQFKHGSISFNCFSHLHKRNENEVLTCSFSHIRTMLIIIHAFIVNVHIFNLKSKELERKMQCSMIPS